MQTTAHDCKEVRELFGGNIIIPIYIMVGNKTIGLYNNI